MSGTDRVLRKVGGYLDDRHRGARALRYAMRKVFPDHWTFLLGEISLYTFVILLLSGTFLTLFFQPSMTEVVYHGSYTSQDALALVGQLALLPEGDAVPGRLPNEGLDGVDVLPEVDPGGQKRGRAPAVALPLEVGEYVLVVVGVTSGATGVLWPLLSADPVPAFVRQLQDALFGA